MKYPRPKLLSMLMLVPLCAVMLLAVNGCSAEQRDRLEAGLTEAREASAAIDPVIADLESQLQNAPIGDDLTPVIEALGEARIKKGEWDAIADASLEKLATIDDPGTLLGELLVTTSPAVPQPYGFWVGLLGGAIATFSEVRRRKTQKAAENVVISIEKSKTPDGQIDFRVDGDTLRSRMSSEAKELVEKAQSKVKPWVEPIGPLLPYEEADPAVERTAA